MQYIVKQPFVVYLSTMSGRDYSRLARLVKPMGSLDFESETGLFQHISAGLRSHGIFLYSLHILVFFVSPN
ncbi:MAG: hypothetical protein WBN08_11765, partial [Thiogranum sp.]